MLELILAPALSIPFGVPQTLLAIHTGLQLEQGRELIRGSVFTFLLTVNLKFGCVEDLKFV